MRVRNTLLAMLCATGAVLVATTAPTAAITTPVDITVTLIYGGDTRQFTVSDVVPGPGPELTEADENLNDGLCGAVEVDIDPDADTITLTGADGDCFFEEAYVSIGTTEIQSVEIVSDNVMIDALPGDLSLEASGISVAYLPVDTEFQISGGGEADPGTTVLSYAVAQPAEPEASLTPAEVTAGTPVTVSGTLCNNSPVLATVAPEGGTPFIDDEEQVVADEEGAWTFDIDTAGLEPGTYTVATRCVFADLQGFDYEVLSFTVVADEPVVPAEPADPVPAEPTFTG